MDDMPLASLVPARLLKAPAAPSKELREQHAPTHLPYAPWCELRRLAKGRDDAHRSTTAEQALERTYPEVQADYVFLGSEGEAVAEADAKITVLTL
eukprot:4930934-Alexandrium_andersonii.AAC.1